MTTKSGRYSSDKPNQANAPKSDGLEKRAVVVNDKEKKAHVDTAKKVGQDPDPQPEKK